MLVLSRFPRWSVEVDRTVVILAIVLAVGAVYQARGGSHETVYWGCLYAGSLSQVGTAQPANCGRGTAISWNAQGVQGLPGTPGISGLTTVRQTTGGSGGAGSSIGFDLECEDGRVPIGSGYVMDTNPPGGTIISASYVLTGDEDNPYGFEYYGDLGEDDYVWTFSFEHTVDDAEFEATVWVYCAWVEPTPET